MDKMADDLICLLLSGVCACMSASDSGVIIFLSKWLF